MNTLSICLILVLGPFSITRPELQTVMSVANAKAHEAGINIKVKKIATMKEFPHKEWDASILGNQQVDMFWRYRRSYPKLRNCNNYHLIVPPMITDDKTRYMAGVSASNSACNGRGFGISGAVAVSKDGEDRLEASGLVMAHELMHQSGARHIASSLNLMSTYFPSGVRSEELPVLEKTKEQLCR